MAACIANTSSVGLAQDGAGTLRADVLLSPNNNNSVAYDATGIVKVPYHIRYGWGAAANFTLDTYNAPVVIPGGGISTYGPEIQAQYQSPRANSYVGLEIGHEIQAGYSDTNAFSGITFTLQASFDHAGWTDITAFAHYQAAPCTVRWPCHAKMAVPADTQLRNVWFRMVVTAGSFGTGAAVTAQISERRYVDVVY